MYGIVNQAVEDLVRTNFGDEEWLAVKEAAGIKDLVFVDKQNYDDELTFKLVHAACEIFMQSPEILLRLFGRHWIMFTGREGWHEYFDMTSADVIGFLNGLSAMHAKVREAMPDARPPKIVLREVADGFELEYHSDRDGLALFFQGIVEGLAEYYEEAWVIDQIRPESDQKFDCFRLRRLSSVLKNQPQQDAA